MMSIGLDWVLLLVIFFFFSSRRRHTRFKCDWSSDVCSSDLEDFEIALVQPRDRKSEQFVALVDHIYQVLTQPEVQHVPPSVPGAPGSPSSAHAGPVQKHPMLPHARPGGIAGLLEILADRDGRDDLHRLAGELKLEVDDLLPIVESAAMLGFLRVDEGDAEITAEG